MHTFKCIVGDSGHPAPITPSQKKLFYKLLESYRDINKTFTVIISDDSKYLSPEQIKVYNAFIWKAADHFGNTFPEMQTLLSKFQPSNNPGEEIPIRKWNTQQLNTFIDKASSHLAQYGFNF